LRSAKLSVTTFFILGNGKSFFLRQKKEKVKLKKECALQKNFPFYGTLRPFLC
jgi:hypothetical protein